MKRLKLVMIILLMLPLTGCVTKYTATEKQTNMVAEYTAGLILENDNDYNQALIPNEKSSGDNSNVSKTTQAPTPSVSVKDNQSGNNNENIADIKESSDINNVFENDNFDIKYKSYKITNTYPEDANDALIVLNHSKGYKLMVLKFAIKNKTNDTKTLSLIDSKIEYRLEVHTVKYTPLLSVLENNLQYLDMKISGKKTKTGILIFQIPDNSDTSNMLLHLSNGDKTATVILK